MVKARVSGEGLGKCNRRVPRGLRGRHVAKDHQRKLRTSGGSPRHRRPCTAKASCINRIAAKSRCARNWGGWGRLSVDGPGQNNPDRSEDPWGRATKVARMAAPKRATAPTQSGTYRLTAMSAKEGSKPDGRDNWAPLSGRHLLTGQP
jgi:hypothetical protein